MRLTEKQIDMLFDIAANAVDKQDIQSPCLYTITCKSDIRTFGLLVAKGLIYEDKNMEGEIVAFITDLGKQEYITIANKRWPV